VKGTVGLRKRANTSSSGADFVAKGVTGSGGGHRTMDRDAAGWTLTDSMPVE